MRSLATTYSILAAQIPESFASVNANVALFSPSGGPWGPPSTGLLQASSPLQPQHGYLGPEVFSPLWCSLSPTNATTATSAGFVFSVTNWYYGSPSGPWGFGGTFACVSLQSLRKFQQLFPTTDWGSSAGGIRQLSQSDIQQQQLDYLLLPCLSLPAAFKANANLPS